MTDKSTIVLVDDERTILTSVGTAFEAEGFAVRAFSDPQLALEALISEPADLGIFDIKMPRMDGMELLRRLRQHSSMPVIFLTSKDEEIDQLFGLKMGADDYIAKPFSQRLVVERAKAVLRRAQASHARADGPVSDADIMTRGPLRLDIVRHTCSWHDEPVALTVTEFLILRTLAGCPGVIFSRDALMDAAYDDQVYVDDRTIDSHIKRLRKKIKHVDDGFEAIETLYGVGYRWKDAWSADNVVERGLLSLNLDRVEAKLGTTLLDLTAVEFGLLREISRQPGTPRTRAELLHDAYRHDRARADERAIDKAVARLRKKLRAAMANYDPIVAVPGVGYQFAVDRQGAASADEPDPEADA